ncbi:MAG: four helix bundle suffix domain-containing protein [Verrucomicrobiales bacterium]
MTNWSNAAHVLVGVACVLDRQIEAQAKALTEEGGFTERLYRVRISRRRQQQQQQQPPKRPD